MGYSFFFYHMKKINDLQTFDKLKTSFYCEFDILYDIRIACIFYILYKYRDSSYLKDEIKYATPYYLKYLLITKPDRNPLVHIFKDEYKDQLEDIYSSLINTDLYREVLHYSILTDIVSLLYSITDSTGYRVTVHVKNEYEREKLKDTADKCGWNVILEKEYSNINLDNYSTVFLYDALDMAKFNNLYSKTIYLSDIALNYEEYHTKAPKAITLAKASTNIIKFISLYADFKLPREDTEGEI